MSRQYLDGLSRHLRASSTVAPRIRAVMYRARRANFSCRLYFGICLSVRPGLATRPELCSYFPLYAYIPRCQYPRKPVTKQFGERRRVFVQVRRTHNSTGPPSARNLRREYIPGPPIWTVYMQRQPHISVHAILRQKNRPNIFLLLPLNSHGPRPQATP